MPENDQQPTSLADLEAAANAIENESTPSVEVPSQAAAPVVQAESGAPVIPAAGAAPVVPAAFTPNFKFKYTGKNGDKWGDAEGEFDEPIKSAIKTKEDEEKFKKIYEKAHGFDFVADGRDRARHELKQYQTQWQPIVEYAQKASQLYQEGDMRGFMQVLGVKKEDLRRLVFEDLQEEDLKAKNPQQYQMIEQNRTLSTQLKTYEQQITDFEQKNLQFQQRMIDNELTTAFSKPEVATFKSSFDAANGENAFENEVRARGETIYVTQGRVASPSEVVQDIIKKFSFGQPSPANPQVPMQQSPSQTVIPATQKPAIPVVNGGAISPVRKQVQSFAELEALANEM